ncbi:hypothetical protein O7A70_29920 [Mesorhizobium sp. Cs1299R1N1]|uniref:hypothetical protein n=1 Tax=unclassified Mesorhizobium TaxID=325217 RepID=UPI00122F9FF1|nr:hypothetical protein [Mesorhizobium sp. SARCC-RB16n]KAA3448449.1 hypothetical protein C7I87_21680 [Mesorhizobium sp. SARCC-RB16n]
MSFEDIQTASVIRYPYLWAREAASGETEGRKSRPVVVGVRLVRAEGDLVLFFPITTKQPGPGGFAVELPDIEKRRAGLDAALRLWIIFDEYNTDIVGQSFYLEPDPPLGRLSKAFFLPLAREFIARRKGLVGVRRTR